MFLLSLTRPDYCATNCEIVEELIRGLLVTRTVETTWNRVCILQCAPGVPVRRKAYQEKGECLHSIIYAREIRIVRDIPPIARAGDLLSVRKWNKQRIGCIALRRSPRRLCNLRCGWGWGMFRDNWDWGDGSDGWNFSTRITFLRVPRHQSLYAGKQIRTSKHSSNLLSEDLEFDLPLRDRRARPKDCTFVAFDATLEF